MEQFLISICLEFEDDPVPHSITRQGTVVVTLNELCEVVVVVVVVVMMMVMVVGQPDLFSAQGTGFWCLTRVPDPREENREGG